MDFTNCLKKYLPEIKSRMEVSTKADLAAVEKLIGQSLPEAFKQLYEEYNGEKEDIYTGVCLGFTLMSTESILDTLKFFQENKTWEITSLSAGKVRDAKMCDRIMVPFAWDGSRGYLCLDMSPDSLGKKGQVVGLDDSKCTLISDSMEEFYTFMLQMLEEKKCFLDWEIEEEKYFAFEGGHFFDKMSTILAEKDDDKSVVKLPEIFWQDYFGTNEIPAAQLRTVYELMISKGELNISLEPIVYMSNLRELVIHNCTITDFEVISQAAQLKRLVMVNCTFAYEKLAELAKLTKFEILTLRKMPVTDIRFLKEVKSLKVLKLLSLENLDVKQLAEITQLQELQLEDLKVDNVDFLINMKELKKLEIDEVNVPNLEFFQHLKNLTHLILHDRVADESCLESVKNAKQLEVFKYPFQEQEEKWKDDIVVAFEKMYPGQTDPIHFEPSLASRLRGQEPLERVNVYDGGDYWHFVTFGFSESSEKQSENEKDNGPKTEFTFKLKKVSEEEDKMEVKGVYDKLQIIARISLQVVGYSQLYTGQEIGLDAERRSNITGYITLPEPKLTYVDTTKGRIELIEFVGATDAELKKIMSEEITVQELYEKLGTDVTSYHRKSCY